MSSIDLQNLGSMELANDYRYITATNCQFGVSIINQDVSNASRVAIHVATPRFIPSKGTPGTTTKVVNSALTTIEIDIASAHKLRDLLNQMVKEQD